MIDCKTDKGKVHMERASGTTVELVADINIIVISLYKKIWERSKEEAKKFKLAYLESTVFFAENSDDFVNDGRLVGFEEDDD